MQQRSIEVADITKLAPEPKHAISPPSIIAIAACNEAARLGRCLAALAMLRDCHRAPIPRGAFGILLLPKIAPMQRPNLAVGADCVAGYIDADAPGIVSLGTRFLARRRPRNTYLSLVAEIDARRDPRL
jgi:hypothetical protein